MREHSDAAFHPSRDQAGAIEAIAKWYENPRHPFVLLGAAGTGKTSVIRHIPRFLNAGNAAYASLTGAAANVLRSKGCSGAQTIHSLIYRISIDKDGKKSWELNKDSRLRDCDLLIIDEISMVNTKQMEDLLSFKKPTIVVGDPFQLPPANGGAALLTPRSPAHTWTLSEIHRQALDNPVLGLATRVRSGELLQHIHPVLPVETLHTALSVDQVIVGTRKSRWDLVRRMRAARGARPDTPGVGDKIMILNNNRKYGVFNGQQGIVLEVKAHSRRVDALDIVFRPAGVEYSQHMLVSRAGFISDEAAKAPLERGWADAPVATFAEAITCHKAQGSEWGSVLLLDESWCWKRDGKQMNWQYTGITRAKTSLYLARGVA